MGKQDIEKVADASPNAHEDRIQALKDLFPETVAEGKVDFDKLRALLGENVDARPERYSFTWAGKRDAIQLLRMPSRATFIPDREESVNFDTTKHLFIKGDNLEVLKLLYKPYFGRVKMIYIDPPYNTGKDFVYPDNYADPLDTYLRLTGQKDGNGNHLTSNLETNGRYHSAWLSMMYPRLFLARQLLREDGVILISIDDHEVHDLRLLMNEVFGEENFVATIIWQKIFSPKNTARHLSEDHDYVVLYARNAALWEAQFLPRTEAADARYSNPDDDPRGPWSSSDLTGRNYYSEGTYEVVSPGGRRFVPPTGRYWVVRRERFAELDNERRIWWGTTGNNMPRLKRFLSDVKQGIVPQTLWKYEDVGHTQEAKKELLQFVAFQNTDNVLDTVKPTRLIQRALQIGTSAVDNDIVLDFFARSCVTAHAVLNQNREDGGNRRFVCVQLPERLPEPEAVLWSIADIGKERIRRVIAKMRQESEGTLPLAPLNPPVNGGIEGGEDLGFRAFKLAESNIRRWTGVEERTAEAWLRQMELFLDPLLEGWTVENVLYEVALREGYGLACRIEKDERVTAQTVYRVADPDKEQSFSICLDETLSLDALEPLRLTKESLFICRGIALDDTTAANLALRCRLKTL